MNFLKFGILEKHHISNDETKKFMVSEQSCMSARKWSLVVNSHLRVAVGHPFLALGGLKDVPQAPVWEHVTSFNTAGHLPVARGGTPVSLRAHISNQSHREEEKSYWRWKVTDRCQLKHHTATV
jgi:hypothetical protein